MKIFFMVFSVFTFISSFCGSQDEILIDDNILPLSAPLMIKTLMNPEIPIIEYCGHQWKAIYMVHDPNCPCEYIDQATNI